VSTTSHSRVLARFGSSVERHIRGLPPESTATRSATGRRVS